MRMDAGRFTVRLAENEDDVRAAQRLRYRVFVEEMGAAASAEERADRLERDAFDAHCDHLILIDREKSHDDPLDQVAGVYRLMRGDMAASGPGFYTANEFDLAPIVSYPGQALELGRSCVARDYRGGAAMQLLWMGLAQYVTLHDISIMFGCASFAGVDRQPIAHSLALLHHGHLAPETLRPRSRPEHYQPLALVPEDEIDRAKAMRDMPALIKGYLRLGGFVGDGAYIDEAFRTIDVCLVMETARIADRYRSFYSRQAPETLDRILG